MKAASWAVGACVALFCAQAWANTCDGDGRVGCDTECLDGSGPKCHALGDLLVQEKREDAAIDYFLAGCKAEFAWSCYQLGVLRPREYKRQARNILNKDKAMCRSKDDAFACIRLGLIHRGGTTVKKSDRQAKRFFARACDLGHARGCTQLGVMLADEGRKLSKAMDLLAQGCVSKVAVACARLGIMHENGIGTAVDKNKALKLYTQGCGGGSMAGCVRQGSVLEERGGAARDEKARELFEKACDGGEPAGCLRLGGMYEIGKVVGQDFRRARELFQVACDAHVEGSCARLGRMYRLGLGMKPDISRAFLLFDASCTKGDPYSCNELGVLYLNGEGAPYEPVRARSLLTKGCDGDVALACERLSDMYAAGVGGRRKLRKARFYRKRACDLGRADTCEKPNESALSGG